MPHISPSRCSNSSVTPAAIAGERKNAVINLPEPSGSSPPEKPPGIKIICEFFIFCAKASTDSLTAAEERFLITKISGSAPAAAIALAVSYSQLVPGNTGISTRGFATGAALAYCTALYVKAGISSFLLSILQGYTGSNLFSYSACSCSSARAVPR